LVLRPQTSIQAASCRPDNFSSSRFGKPAALFGKFPHKDVFVADMDGR
jgi:hypothetical protein